MILGFDPSLTSSGFCYTDQEGNIHTGRIKANDLRQITRLQFIRDSFIELLKVGLLRRNKYNLVVYEGYAMGGRAQRGRFFDMGELGGVLKLVAIERGFDILVVPPTNLKQFATETGNAKKPEITKAIASLWNYHVKQNDEADAFALMKLGEAWIDRRVARVYSEKRRSSLEKCQLFKGQK